MNAGDLMADGLVGVCRQLVWRMQIEADLIRAAQERTTTCAVDGCWVLLDEVCPACSKRVTHA